MLDHVRNLVEWSECAGMMGLPYGVWAIREWIPSYRLFTAFHGQMPVTRERRYFWVDGKVQCHHPYWPADAIQMPCLSNWRAVLEYDNQEPQEEIDHLSALTARVGAQIDGDWSIDWLYSFSGDRWYCIDMAESRSSFHWSGCRFDPHSGDEHGVPRSDPRPAQEASDLFPEDRQTVDEQAPSAEPPARAKRRRGRNDSSERD